MKKPSSIPEAVISTTTPLPPIRLVHAFREAVEASKPEDDSSEEALALERLMIAGDASFTALSRLHDFLFQVAYSREGAVSAIDPWIVEESYEVWLDAADSLIDRVLKQEETCYESAAFATYRKERAQALEFLDESRERRRLGRQALRTDQLAALASKLKTLQEDHGDRGAEE